MSKIVELAGAAAVGLPILAALIIVTVAAYALMVRGMEARGRIPFRERAMWGL